MDQLLSQLSWPIVIGGLSVALIGLLTASLNKLPSAILRWIKSMFLVELEVTNSDALFDWFKMWLDQQPYMQRSRRISASASTSIDSQGDVYFSPAPGWHLMRYNGRLLWVLRERSETRNYGFMETLRFRVLGRSQNLLREIITDAQRARDERMQTQYRIFTSRYNDWHAVASRNPRPLDSIILDEQIKADLLTDCTWFRGAREWYRQLGIPYRRGYLFEGLPGTGKTSLALALAGHFKMDVYILSLNSTNEDSLRMLISSIPDNAILLFEDIDAAFVSREENPLGNKSEKISLSALLNALDGAFAKEGVVTIMTTNHKHKLDPALIRPGRIDIQLTFGPATEWQLREMYRRFNPKATVTECEDFTMEAEGITMAQAQERLMRIAR